MLNILIIGAKLQGVEAMYLARKAGYYIVAVDHNAGRARCAPCR